jgi:hypothetical protein
MAKGSNQDRDSTDRLSPFFAHFSFATRVFFAGRLCGMSHDHATKTAGHLHLLRSGVLHIIDESGRRTTISDPTVVLFLRPEVHTLQSEGADNGDEAYALLIEGINYLGEVG